MTPECKHRIPLGLRHQVVVRIPVFSFARKSSSHAVCISRLLFAPLLLLATIAGCSSKEEKPAPPPLGVTVTPVVQKDVRIHQEWVGTMVGNVDAEIRPKVEGFLLTWNLNNAQWTSTSGTSAPAQSLLHKSFYCETGASNGQKRRITG